MNNWNGLASAEKRLYGIWCGMIQRCENPMRDSYANYGGRGIEVCDEWHDFANFVDWSRSNGYASNLTIDRIDNDEGYRPGNCRWADLRTQARNKRSNVNLSVLGETKTAKEWAEETGISEFTVYWWISNKGSGFAEMRLRKAIESGKFEKESPASNGTVRKRFECKRCGITFEADANFATYCLPCRKQVRKEHYRRMHEKRKAKHCGAEVVER